MKKVFFAFTAMGIALALTPVALANSLTFNHDSATITLVSDNPADQGMVTLTDFAYIKNTSGTKSLTIQGFEFYLGGAAVDDAASDTPSTFLGKGNDWTYLIGEGDLTPSAKNAKGTKWAKNENPLIVGAAVQPIDSSTRDYLSSVSVINNSSSGYCYTTEVLGPGQECQVELLVLANYGGAIGSASDTFIYGYADGKLSGSGAGAVSDSQFQAMEERIQIDVAPEPRSLVLLGSGFGLIGLVVFLRHRRAASHRTIA